MELCLEPGLHRGDERQRPDAPCRSPGVGGLAADGCLNGIEFDDAPERFGRDGRAGGLVHLIELATRMGPTCRELNVAAVTQPLEAGIAVNLNDAFESRKMSSRTLGSAVRTVEVDGRRRIGSIPGPVIAGVDPEPTGLGAAATGIKHRDRRVVGEHRLRGEDVLGEACLQRLQPPDRAANPIGEGRAIQLDTVPGEDLALPIKRKVIAVFGDQDMGKKAGSGHAFGDRPIRGRGLVNGAAGPAAISRPVDADDTKPGRHMIEHLADGLADPVQFAAAAGTGPLSEIDPHLLAGQMRRHAGPIDL